MSNELFVLMITALSIAFFHTIFGPDHYVPFVVLAKARKWSYLRTSWVTFLCGVGHVMSSVVLGLIGIALGLAVSHLEIFESVRGNWAGWAMIAFGIVYLIYGIRSAVRNKPHQHLHFHSDSKVHEHEHVHSEEHVHPHETASFNMTPWVLFIVFVFGPCEPLIPLLMYPASKMNISSTVLVAVVFSIVTIATMLSIVLMLTFGINLIPLKKLERYSHALAGFAILACGVAIQMGF